MHVSALYYYPIKSCGAVAVQQADMDARGIRYDRRLMVVDPHGRFLTQRDYPRMALVRPQVQGKRGILSAPDMSPLMIDLRQSGTAQEVVVWRDRCQAIDQGDTVAAWLSTYLQTSCRLVAMAQNFMRRVDSDYAQSDQDQVGFADGYPFLLISEGSLADLNGRMATPLPMNRFRPNIVVTDCEPFAEDTWQSIRIGAVEFAVVKSCVRCVLTTTNQDTAERGKEPLRTLATYRNMPDKGVIFGQNLIHLCQGAIRVGDTVHVTPSTSGDIGLADQSVSGV